MHLIVGVVVLVCMFVVAPLWRRYRLSRANSKFQHSIWVYDEARRARILAGEDPRSIPTAEENLVSTGWGSQVGNIKRLPRPDPVVHRPAPSVPVIPQPATAALVDKPAPQTTPPRPAPSPMFSRPSPLPDRRVAPAPPAPLIPIRLPTVRPTSPSLQYEMTYATEWGEVTERRIRLKRAYSEHGEVYVEAHCYLRREQRTFRADRMSDLVEVDTDTPIGDPIAHFLGFIEPEQIVTPGHELVMARARPGLHAMVWIGRAAGELDPDTIAVLSAFCAERARMNRGATDFNAALAARWIADQRPTFEIASGSLARMKRGGPEWQMTYETARNVVACNAPEKRYKRLVKLFRP